MEEKINLLANYLDADPEDVDEIDDETYSVSGATYLVLDRDEAKYEARNTVESIYNDLGLDAYSEDFREWVINNALDETAVEEFVNDEIDYFTNDEPDQSMVDYLNGLTDKVQYVKDTLGPDTFNEWAKDKVDFDEITDGIIQWDGIGSILASYDGDEIDLGEGYSAFRID